MTVRHWRDLLGLIIVGLAIRLYFAPAPGHVVDMNTFGQWALHAADAPWDRGYESTDMNYPPAALIFFELIGRGYRALHLNDPDGTLLRVAVKLPTILFDILGGIIAYVFARRFVEHRQALIAAGILLLNPAMIYDGAYWGQNDSITSVTALAAVWCYVSGWRQFGWLLLAFAVLNKPPVIVIAPFFAIEAFLAQGAERTRRLRATAEGIAGSIALGYLCAYPFYDDRSFFGVYARMLQWYQTGSGLYPYNSANAFNVFGLFGEFFASDQLPVLGIPLKYWGYAVFIAALVVIGRRYVLRPGDVPLMEAAFLAMLAFFLFLTEMHERYLIYAITLVPVLAVLRPQYRLAAGILTLTEWLNLEYSLNYMWINQAKPPGIDPHQISPVLIRLCSVANIGVFVNSASRDE